MLKEIEAIRESLRALDALDEDTRDALLTIEHALEEIERHPVSSQVREVVTQTAGALAAGDQSENEGLSGKWEDLKGQLIHWEEEHPRLVLAIGRISNSLAAFGL
ncbi:MAG: hypothetical protein KDN18_11750 [Verrucomicrobiae bacterium]|nr:hypothetical protein [Verrucomicrobiae bacterium]